MNTRTNIVLDDKLIAKAMKRAGVTTKKAAVEAALKAYVAKPDYSALLAMHGSRLVSDDYDPKAPYGIREGFAPMIASEPAPSGGALAPKRAPRRRAEQGKVKSRP